MRISPDKLNKLAHTVADTLAEIDQVGFLEDRNTIRQEARKALTTLLTEEAAHRHRPPASRSPTSARSSWKARRSGRSSTASTTTTKSASWASEPAFAVFELSFGVQPRFWQQPQSLLE